MVNRVFEVEEGGARPVWLRRLAGVEGLLVVLMAAAVSLSIAASEITFLLAAAIRTVRWLAGERPRQIPHLLYWALAVLLAAWLISGVFSPQAAESLQRVHRLYLCGVMFLVFEHTRQPMAAKRLVAAYLIGAILSALYGLGHFLFVGLPSQTQYRLEGFFSTAMTAGNVHALALVGALTVAVAGRSGIRTLSVVATAVSGGALLATYTRSSWLGAVAGLTAVIVTGKKKWLVVSLLVLGLVASLAVPAVQRRVTSAFDPADFTARGRISLWLSGLEVYRERPITGWGLADHSQLIAQHRRADATFEAGHFHSNPVQIAVATGTVGLVAYAFFHLVIVALLWRRLKESMWARAAFGVWITFHLAGLFDWSFGDAEVVYQYFWWMGIGIAGARQQAR